MMLYSLCAYSNSDNRGDIMSITLEQLIQNRQELIEAHRKNNFTDGIHKLLTDLYPDTAHFIYELLQNAEDMQATTVRFILDKDSIDFEHNGTKRSFNIEDIDAITNIGHNSQKKDDPTSIGKFGVGFKAVFTYTSTPIIHSGDYHFKIKDYFVPDIHDVESVNTVDNDGVAWTKFSFPFNNPMKTAKVAFDECLEGLRMLDASAVLFLQNIKKIEYMLPTGDLGHVELVDNGDHHVTVTYKTPDEQRIHKSRWLRFDRTVNITDDHGNPKTLPIAVAFALKWDERSKKDYIAPVAGGGRTFIYFPTEKEHSGLRFHINAPFASTVARASVRNCPDNVKLIRAISQLLVDSLQEIKMQGLMNHAFFEVLPHKKDNLSPFYQHVFDYVYSAFQTHDYLPTKNGGYVAAPNALAGPAAISNVLREAEMQVLFGIEKTWIMNAAQRNSHADSFIQSLSVQTFTFKDFSRVFILPVRVQTEQLLKKRQSDWLKRFYALCADTYDNLDYSLSNAFVLSMKQATVIRSSKGEMFPSANIYILPVNVSLITKTTPIVESSFIIPTSKTDKTCEKIYAFFRNKLEIREYGPRVEVEKLLRAYDDELEVSDQYFKDLIVFAKYKAEHNDVDFSTHEIFLYLDAEDNDLYCAKASDLFLGSSYKNPYGERIAPIYGKNCLWQGYSEHYTEKELPQFLAFVSACGISKGLTIEEKRARDNPQYYSCLYSDRRETEQGIDSDYTIPELKELLKLRDPQISKLIWSTLEKYGKSFSGDKYTTARYKPNGSAPLRTCDSILIYHLKEYAWLPNKRGELFRPEDITDSELRNDFVYNPDNKIMAALKIGSTAKKQSREREKLEQEVDRLGMSLITKEEREDFEAYKRDKARLEAQKNVAALSSRELLKKQNKKSASSGNSNANFYTDNVSRKEINIEATFRNAKQMSPAKRKLFARTVESTKAEKNQLRKWYRGQCQMCKTVIIGCNHAPHFVAKNVINTQDLPLPVRQTTFLAWNSLCLCPNCATKYDVCSKNLDEFWEQIMQTEIIEGSLNKVVLSIELDEKIQDIQYDPEHFMALKKVMQLIDDDFKK